MAFSDPTTLTTAPEKMHPVFPTHVWPQITRVKPGRVLVRPHGGCRRVETLSFLGNP